MKKVILITLVISVFFNCNNKTINSDLLGNWSAVNNGSNYVNFQFCKDSMIIDIWDEYTKFSWGSDSTKIYCTQLTNIDPNCGTDFIFEYKLSPKKDILFIKRDIDSLFSREFIRIRNAYQYFESDVGFKVSLPFKNKVTDSSKSSVFDINIYAKQKENGKLLIKVDDFFVSNLDEIVSMTHMHLLSFSESEYDNAKYMLFFDENISNKKVDSIKNLLKKARIHKVFTVYKTDNSKYKETNWKDEITWYGQEENIKINDSLIRKKVTCKDGAKKAKEDFKKGIYNCFSYGLILEVNPEFSDFLEEYRKNKYGIISTNAGCVITDYSKCYSKTMKELVLNKFGSDIFEKSKKEAEELFNKMKKTKE